MEAVECGAAALGIILAYYGRIVPLAELRIACGVSRDGSNAANVLRAAGQYGLEAKGFKVPELEDLREIELPFIAFWNFNHFIVVEGIGKNQVYLNDPGTGPRSVDIETFDAAFTGVVLSLKPGDTFQKGGAKTNLLHSLWSRLRTSQGVLLYCIFAGFLLVIPELVTPVFTQIFIDEVLIANRSDWLRPLMIGMGIIAIVEGILTFLQLKFLRRMQVKLSMGMSSQFIWHILRLPVSFYDQRYAGEISSRIQLNDRLAQLLSGELATTAISAVMVVFYIFVMVYYNQVLSLVGILAVGLNLVTLQWVSQWRVNSNLNLIQEQGKVSGLAISGLQSIETLKASGLESDFFTRWSGQFAKALNSQQRMEMTNHLLGLVPTLLSAMTMLLVLALGGWYVMTGDMTIGMLIAFQSLIQSFMDPANQLVNLGSKLQVVEGDLNRLDDVLQNSIDPALQATTATQTATRKEEDEEQKQSANFLRLVRKVFLGVEEEEREESLAPTRSAGALELRDLTFGYSRVAPPLIENFNLTLTPGQRIALVGGSGSGKSTVAKLVAGLYQPWQGDILLNGSSRDTLSRQEWIYAVALVSQDILLPGNTIRDNLTLWNSTISTEQLLSALTDAALSETIQSMGGLDTQLLEGGSNLSGGQRQRLEIARALVHNPSILILDEATSALDPETEQIIDRNIRRRNCTCLIVAHRLSTIRDCDQIIVLEQGKVVQQGTHEQLKQENGAYLKLIQSEGAMVEEHRHGRH
jgi:NHLM bacteriocin system ABC transporter peptidase/ATP-binding protein